MPAARRLAVTVATTAAVVAVLIGGWELYRWIWISAGWTWPFVVDNTSMPHVHTIVQALFQQPTSGAGDILIVQLFHAALFTAKEAAVGFVLGASVGFALGVFMSQWRILQRGLLPYVVASQTVPILAVAPIVVVYLGTLHVAAWFPVAINTLRGLLSTDRRAVELMRAFAASRWKILWKLRVPAALPYIFSALKVSATACVVGAIIGEAPSSIQEGLGGYIVNFNQYYTLSPQNLWATNVIAAAVGIAFFLVIVLAEKLVVTRAPEHVA